MPKCHECGTENIVGTLICEECGFPLIEVAATVPERIAPIGTTILDSTQVVIEFKGYPAPVEVKGTSRVVFGRLDVNAANKPDIDLTPYGAFEKGVSRIHAAFVRHESSVTILDLGSANGTSVNGKRLPPNQPRVLQDGDEIMFGELGARVYFKQR
jgi:pSer/pThr/pTyr-binding forkhead associated (FHA) protein